MTVSPQFSRTESWALTTLTIACFGVLANVFQGDGNPVSASLAFSGICYTSTYCMIKWLGATFIKANLKGRDMSKLKKVEIPEAMGAVAAIVYLLAIITFIPFPFYKDIVTATSGGGNRDFVIEAQHIETGRLLHKFPHNKLASYLSAILSLQVIVILGIGDDLFDIRWRHKVLIPAFGAIPVLIVYFVDFGVTQISLPTFLRPYVGGRELVDLGVLYYLYMAGFAIFCPNSINILAGINGIEVAQSLVLALLILLNDVLYLLPSAPYPHPAIDSHLFSVYLLLPFVGVSLALLKHNWFPSKVFVGDTYCYFAGMLFAVDGILGHFSKTLWLLLIPQVFNFIYSAPQILHLVPCPRHRLPHFNVRTGLMEPSRVTFERPLRPIIQTVMKIAAAVKLLDIKTDESGNIIESSNFTIINLWLVWFGPMREDRLAMGLIALQIACGLLGLFIRHKLALLIFTSDNLQHSSII
ncbi:N-acetylglucosaminephosphotransferas-like protein [Microthyrium microscopicum]|uniref:UDP-N-acetylglucosamine--dolichyl-phosphate N-acetylglucosaminephosphotransferase n=1 Tax=Microthyrium microscopicum TaxID=703497 RepID=A0A6A6U1S2_9PEZI|nr:N-acetylglucosaminephosphotransferas-like protein [Microthyrium microscopicum]